MKALSYLLVVAGLLLGAYAIVGRIVGSPTVGFFGFYSMRSGSVLLGVNTLLLLSILATLYAKK